MLRFASILFLFISTIDLHSQPMDAELIKTFKTQEKGITYFTNGNPEKALPLLLESKKRLEKKLGNNSLAVAGACYMLGGVYSSLENDKESLYLLDIRFLLVIHHFRYLFPVIGLNCLFL